jgi:hypothetical protein
VSPAIDGRGWYECGNDMKQITFLGGKTYEKHEKIRYINCCMYGNRFIWTDRVHTERRSQNQTDLVALMGWFQSRID